MDIKNKVQNLDPSLHPRDVHGLAGRTANIYETLAVISKRAKQLTGDLKQELHAKLEEFAVSSDTIEEIHENKEQIEISKFYERLPNPAIIATEEFLNQELEFRYKANTEEKKKVIIK
ncbi:MAG: DNA-directed RNA polymerase subunit omega [Saprospiraceae bacterium]|nr:DNA-directed RNA polymerase subunit omega [Saprospiraceae bacterium]